MAETSGARLRTWLITAVGDLGGAAHRQEVLTQIENRFGVEFSEQDRRPRSGRSGEAAWKNNTDSLYDRLKKQGLFELTRRGDPWRISALGRNEYEVAKVHTRTPAATDGLGEFTPKDDSAYVAFITERRIVKSRDHETVLRQYGLAMANCGWTPRTDVHPRDLELSRAGATWLAEIKMVYDGDFTHAVREALSQLLEYRYFLYPATSRPRLVAVFSQAVGEPLAEFLETLNVASVWRVNDVWAGSPSAAESGLVP